MWSGQWMKHWDPPWECSCLCSLSEALFWCFKSASLICGTITWIASPSPPCLTKHLPHLILWAHPNWLMRCYWLTLGKATDLLFQSQLTKVDRMGWGWAVEAGSRLFLHYRGSTVDKYVKRKLCLEYFGNIWLDNLFKNKVTAGAVAQ